MATTFSKRELAMLHLGPCHSSEVACQAVALCGLEELWIFSEKYEMSTSLDAVTRVSFALLIAILVSIGAAQDRQRQLLRHHGRITCSQSRQRIHYSHPLGTNAFSFSGAACASVLCRRHWKAPLA
jgi:hypothetical protein